MTVGQRVRGVSPHAKQSTTAEGDQDDAMSEDDEEGIDEEVEVKIKVQ